MATFDFDQVVVTLGASADLVRERVDLTGYDVVVVDGADGIAGTGCSSSVAAAVDAVQPGATASSCCSATSRR